VGITALRMIWVREKLSIARCRNYCALSRALVQWPLLRDFSDQFSRSRVEACLLLFFG